MIKKFFLSKSNLFNSLFNDLEIPIMIFSTDFKILECNLYFKKILPVGYELNDFLKDNENFYSYLKKVLKEKVVKAILRIHLGSETENEFEVHFFYRENKIYCYLYPIRDPTKANFSILMDYLPLGIAIHQNHQIVFVNKQALKLLNAQEEKQLIGKNISEFVKPDYQPIVQKRVQNIYNKDEEAPPIEEVLLTLDKKPIIAEVRAKKIHWNHQPAVLVIFQDVSQQHHKRNFAEKSIVLLEKIIQEEEVEKVLRELLETFQIVLRSQLICIWFDEPVNEKNIDDLLNTKKYHIIANKQEDKYLSDWQRIISHLDSPIRKNLLNKKPVFFRNILQEISDPQLQQIFIEYSIISYWCMPFVNKFNQCFGLLINYFGIEQNIAEVEIEYLYQASVLCSLIIERNKIERENFLLSQISRKANDLILLINQENVITWYNEKLKHYFPFLNKNQDIISFIHSLSIDSKDKDWIVKKIYLKESFKSEIEVLIKNEKKYFQFTFEVLKNSHEEILSYYCILQDITKEVEYEKQLIESKNIAEKNAQIKSEFLSIMSHEIRTPLNVIIGIVQLLLENHPREDQLDDLKLLKSSSEHLLSLLNDILDYNKIELRKLELQFEPFDLRELIIKIVEMFEPQIEEKKLFFSCEIAENLPQNVVGDPTRLNQILINIISNAIKFTEKGSIKFIVKPIEFVQDKVKIRFEVEDTGIGIPKDKLMDIFEPFKQLDASKTRRHFGSGLGLAITKKLVDLFNGKILVESEVHKGTRVIIDLPFQIQTNIPKEKEQKEKEMQHDTIKVLIVEDYYPNLLITQKFLEIWKIQSDFATNGEEAIHKVRQNHYDVILMDLHMPIMDGYTATQKIREFNQDIPIIAVTASALEDISEKMQKFGLTDVIIKPFKPDDLYKKIIHYAKKNNPEKSTSDFSI